jgi:hypothetical protein
LGVNHPVPFDRLLWPLDEPSPGKKPRTFLGAITTPNGLEKAIRRCFSKGDASRIIKAQQMTKDEIEQLRKANQRAIERRVEKRVKRENRKKSELT